VISASNEENRFHGIVSGIGYLNINVFFEPQV